jgi:hypothetical protein
MGRMSRVQRCRAAALRALRNLACAGLAWNASGCASIQSDYLATPVDASGRLSTRARTFSGLVVSGEEVSRYASRHFGLIEITFENRSEDWVHIQRLGIDFGETVGNSNVTLPEGPDLDAWYRATLQRNDIEDTNAAAALGGLLLLGETVAVVGSVSHQHEAVAAGGALALAATTVATAQAYDADIQSVERVRPLPSTHLLAVPFGVPPGLFAKKWVLLNTRGSTTPCVRRMLIDYDVAGVGRERVLLQFSEPLPLGVATRGLRLVFDGRQRRDGARAFPARATLGAPLEVLRVAPWKTASLGQERYIATRGFKKSCRAWPWPRSC